MKIQSIHIRNFRKLKNCQIDFGEKETVFVGANNSGKTSAISAIVWFLKSNEKFTLKEFTASNWALIDELGDKWLAKDPVDDTLLDSHQWDDIVPSLDIWIDVADGEQYKVNHLIPSLSTWDGKKVGVRGQYVPKDVTTLYSAYKEAKGKALALQATEEWKKNHPKYAHLIPQTPLPSSLHTIYIRTLTGKNLVMEEIDGETTVYGLKQMIQDREGIPPDLQRLIFRGKLMDDERTLADYEVQNEATIHLILRCGPGG